MTTLNEMIEYADGKSRENLRTAPRLSRAYDTISNYMGRMNYQSYDGNAVEKTHQFILNTISPENEPGANTLTAYSDVLHQFFGEA